MLLGDTAAMRKARGAFFTPKGVARFIADWAVTSPKDAVLEPSCGEAVFLHETGRGGQHQGRLVGVELHAASARAAEATLKEQGIAATIESGDFFEREPSGDYDAVIGNPPYVRYQAFVGEARARAREAALRAGVSLTRLASSWAAFTVHSALFLKPGGRLGLVLPAELLTVNYAAGVREFLMRHFARVGLVMFVERVFPEVQEEVVLLLAEGFDPTGKSGTDHCDVYQIQDVAGLERFADATKWVPTSPGAKWSASAVADSTWSAYSSLVATSAFCTLESWGDTTLGMVTGNNKYFCMSPSRARELGLNGNELVPISPPGSRHLRNLTFTSADHIRLGQSGAATLLFRPDDGLSDAAEHYVRAGEETGVDSAYKCQVRKPWWKVPDVAPADLLLTYMNSDTARLCTNRAGARHLNSVHGIYLHPGVRRLGMDLLPLASLNTVTLLGAEVVGRAYGGGMLKMEPREADGWYMPSPDLVNAKKTALSRLRPRVARRLQQGRLLDAVALVDDVLLRCGAGVAADELASFREAHADLTGRRAARGKGAAGG